MPAVCRRRHAQAAQPVHHAARATTGVHRAYSYWRDWASRDRVAMVKRFARPTLVMHGTRDYQVSSGDFATWQEGLAKERYAELVTLTGVNHLFVAGRGAPSPLEYRVENHVDARVVAKLSAFVKAR